MWKILLSLIVMVCSLVDSSTYAGRDTAHVVEIYAVNVPGLNNWQQQASITASRVTTLAPPKSLL